MIANASVTKDATGAYVLQVHDGESNNAVIVIANETNETGALEISLSARMATGACVAEGRRSVESGTGYAAQVVVVVDDAVSSVQVEVGQGTTAQVIGSLTISHGYRKVALTGAGGSWTATAAMSVDGAPIAYLSTTGQLDIEVSGGGPASTVYLYREAASSPFATIELDSTGAGSAAVNPGGPGIIYSSTASTGPVTTTPIHVYDTTSPTAVIANDAAGCPYVQPLVLTSTGKHATIYLSTTTPSPVEVWYQGDSSNTATIFPPATPPAQPSAFPMDGQTEEQWVLHFKELGADPVIIVKEPCKQG